ncbi:hypothetical protein INT47_011001 [Mucor saturninus]|uniref:Uncharacterized protein n=1 Tax=Mucor saturninus TaxID=64648 RepID=A0A8H7QT53_9FUNG|nr:hypothetical protein INT47_011001 [Mucor saturninus]
MKRNPKIRRNALQAYISYMTYTDIARKRMKQGVHPAPTLSPPHAPYRPRYDAAAQPSSRPPPPPPPTTPPSHTSPHPPPPPPATVNKVIVDKPLTAFLHGPLQQRFPPIQRDTMR